LFPNMQLEALPVTGNAADNLLLHFWPLTALVFGSTRIDDAGESEHWGKSYAIPEVSALDLFCEEHPEMLENLPRGMNEKIPAEAYIDIPAQGALEFIGYLTRLGEGIHGKALIRKRTVQSVEFLHSIRPDPKMQPKTVASGRVPLDDNLARSYQAIRSARYDNPIFRSGLLLALLQDRPWYEPMAKPLQERPWEFFCERDDDSKAQRKWLARQFAADARRKFEEIKKERDSMNKDEPPEKRRPRTLDLIIHDVARQYVMRRAEAREANLPKNEGGAVDWRSGKAQEAKADAARDAFLQLRSRRDQAFIDHFVALFGQFGQYLPAPDEFLTLTGAMHGDTDRVKTVTLLALSANGYVSGRKDTTEEAAK
jgi:CRISPR-associated protein Cmx8